MKKFIFTLLIITMSLFSCACGSNQEKVDKEDGQRLILTFDGDSSFMLIEETISTTPDHQIIPT